jgi:transcriptional regulator GlxA family with amidase domain
MAHQRLGFLLLPRFPMLSLAGALDALAQANEHQMQRLFECPLLSVDGAAVLSSAQALVQVNGTLSTLPTLHGVFVVCDAPLPETGLDDVIAALRAFAQGGGLLGGIGTGAWLLARAGVLKDRRATIHWPYVSLFAQRFAEVVVSGDVHEIDHNRLTCAGGQASFDMMLTWLGQRHGDALPKSLLQHFGAERLRGRHEKQQVPLAARIGGGQPKLAEAVSLMEANLGEPLATEDIAQLVGVSRRQLERLFKQHLDSLPSRWYLELRLVRARQLLQQTSQSILQIGLVCGFSSGPHFSSAYRARFGITPREQRSPQAASVLAVNSPQEPS